MDFGGQIGFSVSAILGGIILILGSIYLPKLWKKFLYNAKEN
jgi:hypothetical protein